MWQRLATLLAVSVCALGITTGAHAAEPVRIGWTAWPEAELVTRLAARILEERMGRQVELVQTDIGPQFQGIAAGDIDVMLMARLPVTHAEEMEGVRDEVVDLGILYDHARLGWVVPDHVPEDELGSIEDLKNDDVRERLGGTIIGIDPGAGLTGRSRQAIEHYGLEGYELRTSSGSGMTAALARALGNGDWIVATGWSPHWMFGAWGLRFLDDPRGVLGPRERVHAIAREGFYGDDIEAAAMLARMWIPIDDLQSAMHHARETSYDEAVTRYIDDNAARVEYWVTGGM